MIRQADPAEVNWVTATIAAAFSRYIPRIGRKPQPMTVDHAALIAAGEVHVLEDGDERLGLIVMRAKPDHLYVDILAVRPEAQGRGLGRQLMAFAEDEARRLGLPALRLFTNAKMTENRRFYPRLGFRELGNRTEDGFERVDFEKRLV
ncbi:MAG TPA: GNAT family N-acetyltransferase [Stellaceae bacterium]|nr:GNAT family N-acetyltransferase [Stellaceae bacterium]